MAVLSQWPVIGPWRRAPVRLPSLLAVLLSLFLVRGIGAQTTDEEYRVKAAFLFHFAQLVDWPPDTLSDASNSFFVCTLGEDSFHGALESTVASKLIGTRVIRIRHLNRPQDGRGCQILFLGKSQSGRIPLLLADLRGVPVLTVGETADFLSAGGMIGFLLLENKVRFNINLDAAGAAGLKIESRLLLLAQNVVGESRGK